MTDGTRILYDALKADGFTDLPDYDTFDTALKDKGKREEVHQRLTRIYEDTPKDFREFDQFLGSRPMTVGENTIRVAKEVGETVVNLPHTLQKGWSEGVAAAELNRDNPNAGTIASALKTARSKPVTTTEKRAATPTEGWIPSGFKENPISWLIETAASSLATMMPEILDKAPAHVLTGMAAGAATGGAAGGVGAAPGAIAGAGMAVPTLMYNSSAVQAQAEYVFGELQKRGVDITSQQAVETALKDKKLIAELKAKAAPGAAVQGFFDGLSGIAAGKIANPVVKKVGGKVLGKVAGESAEFAVQAGAGATGEAGKQIATSGKITDKQAVVAEALAETPAQAVAVRAGKYAVRKAMGVADKTPQAAPPAQQAQQAADMMPDNVRAQVEAEAEDTVNNMPEAPAPTTDLNQAITQQESGDVVDAAQAVTPVVDDETSVDDTQAQAETHPAMQFTEAQPIPEAQQVAEAGTPETTKAEVNLIERKEVIASKPIGTYKTKAEAQNKVQALFNTIQNSSKAMEVLQASGLKLDELFDIRKQKSKWAVFASEKHRAAAAKRVQAQGQTPEAQSRKEPWQMTRKEFEENHLYSGVVHPSLTTSYASDLSNMAASFAEEMQAIGAPNPGKRGEGVVRIVRKSGSKLQTQNEFVLPDGAITVAELRPAEVRKFGAHGALIRKSLEEGKPVPPEVLAEYPDLQPNLGKPGASTTQELRSKQYEEHAGLEARTETIRRESGAEPRPRTPFYEVIPNDATVHQAKALSEGYTTEEIISAIQDMNNNIAPHVRVAMGELVIKRLSKEYKATKNEAILEQQNEIFDWMMNYAEKTGRTLQAFSFFKSLTPEGVLHTFKRTIKKARDRHYDNNKPDVDEILDVVNDKTKTSKEKKQKLDELSKFISKFKPGNKVARQLKPLWGKIVEAGRVGALSREEFYNQVAGKLKLPTYNEATAQKIIALGAKIEAAKEGIQQERAIAELNKFLAQQTGFNAIDLPLGIFYGNILSGYNTSLVNIADTFLNVLSEVNTMVMTNPKAAAFIYSRWMRGYAEGRFDAVLAWTEGRQTSDGKWFEAGRLMDVAEFGKKGGVPIIAKGPASKFAKLLAESKLGTPLNAWKYVTRLLALQDAFQWRAASEARAAQLAFRMAEQQGLKGQAAIDKARDILALNDIQSLRQEAMKEGFTGRDIQARALEIRAALRPTSINTEAADFAGEVTYNHKPHGLLGAVAQQVNVLAGKYPGIKFIVPFTRIVANVTNRKLDWTPYGFKRAFKGYSLAEPLTGEQRQAMLIRATVGTSAMAATAALSAAGLMTIHGNGPDDKERRRQMMSAGWKPFTIEIDGVYYSYINTPLGLGFSIVGNMSDMERYGTGDAWDIGKRGAYATLMIGSTIFSQSFLTGTATLFEALSGSSPGMSISSALSMLSRTGAGLVTPNIIRDVNAIFDSKIYRGDDLMSIMLQNTPFAAASGAKPLLNALGSPVEKVGTRFHSVKTIDPVWRMLIDKGVKVAVPGKTTEIDTENHVRMTSDQYYRYHQMQGQELYDYIALRLPEYEVMDDEFVQEDINEWGKRNRKGILKQIREEYKQNGVW